jgi:hypothetical protein
MKEVSLVILLDGSHFHEQATPFGAAAHCHPYRAVVSQESKTEMMWTVRLISLDHEIPDEIKGFEVYINGPTGHEGNLFQTQPNEPSTVTNHEIKWTCRATINPNFPPGEYAYDISIAPPAAGRSERGHISKIKHVYKIDPLLVISG